MNSLLLTPAGILGIIAHLLLLGAPLAEANARAVGNAVLLGAPVGPATASWRHLAKPLKVPDFFALLDLMEQPT